MAVVKTKKNNKETNFKSTLGKAVVKPKVLEEKYSKVDLLKQSQLLAKAKKGGKADLSALPEGVQASIKNKERIESILNLNDNNTVEGLREKFEIEGKPLTLKRAQEIKEQRNALFEANRNRTSKSNLPLVGERKKRLSDKTTKSTNSKKK